MNNDLLAIHAKSFHWASVFLSKETYNKCSSLYNFCRTLDDIADDNNDLEVKKKNFLEFKNNFSNKNFENPIIKNMWNLLENERISKIVIDDLFNGVEGDLENEVKINSQKDLLVYCYRVAGTVGLMMAKIFGIKKKESLQRAIDLGIAMQLTNIARDVVEDEKKNRIYLIKNSKDTLLDIKSIISKADSFYDSSFVGIKDIPFICRFSIVVARRIYRQIGKKILEKKDIDSYQKAGKIYVSNFGKIIQTIFSLLDLIMLFFIRPRKHEKENEYNLIDEDIGLNERI